MERNYATGPQDIVLLFGGFSARDDGPKIEDLRTNSTYIFKPPADPCSHLLWNGKLAEIGLPAHATVFSLTFSHKPKDRRAWVFGSTTDKDAADFWLHTDNSTGVSRRHLSISLIKTYNRVVPEITCLSKSGLIVEKGQDIMRLGQEDTYKVLAPVRLLFAKYQSFWVWSPDRTTLEERIFRQNVEEFARELNAEPPLYVPSLDSGISTVDVDCRYGLDGAVYRRDPLSANASGATASIFNVFKDGQDTRLVAKEPHYKDQPEISSLEAAENLEREHKMLMKFEHPHVVTAHDFARHINGVSALHPPWLILEDLPDRLFQVPQDNPVALATDILSGLQAIHFAGYIHRDLKPDNIRATQIRLSDSSIKCMFKICDPGSATLQTTADKGFAGTMNYIAPEIWRDSHGYDELVDVFSLGIIALMLFTPYTEARHATERLSSHRAVATWVLEVAGPLVQKAPEPYLPLLYGMLALEPQDRWDTQTCMNYLSCLASPTPAPPSRKRKHGLREEAADDAMSDDARTVRLGLYEEASSSAAPTTSAASTASFDGTFYTAPVVQSGGVQGSGVSSHNSVAAKPSDSLCDTFSWASVGARSIRPAPASLPDPPLPALPGACGEGKLVWIDDRPRADWLRRLAEDNLRPPTDYIPELVDDNDDGYPQSMPVTPRLDEAEVLGESRASGREELCASEQGDICVELCRREMAGRTFVYVVPRWSAEGLAR